MIKENESLEFRYKKADESKIILEEIKHNDSMSKKHKIMRETLNYVQHILILTLIRLSFFRVIFKGSQFDPPLLHISGKTNIILV